MNGVYIIYLIKVNTSNVCIALIFKNTVEGGGGGEKSLNLNLNLKKSSVLSDKKN